MNKFDGTSGEVPRAAEQQSAKRDAVAGHHSSTAGIPSREHEDSEHYAAVAVHFVRERFDSFARHTIAAFHSLTQDENKDNPSGHRTNPTSSADAVHGNAAPRAIQTIRATAAVKISKHTEQEASSGAPMTISITSWSRPREGIRTGGKELSTSQTHELAQQSHKTQSTLSHANEVPGHGDRGKELHSRVLGGSSVGSTTNTSTHVIGSNIGGNDSHGFTNAPDHPSHKHDVSKQDLEAMERAEEVRSLVRRVGRIVGRFHRLGLPETSWRTKMPYREPRVQFLAKGLKWPEEHEFKSEEEKRKFLRDSRKLQPFMFGDIPSWSWIAADIGLFMFLNSNPRWPWSLD